MFRATTFHILYANKGIITAIFHHSVQFFVCTSCSGVKVSVKASAIIRSYSHFLTRLQGTLCPKPLKFLIMNEPGVAR